MENIFIKNKNRQFQAGWRCDFVR